MKNNLLSKPSHTVVNKLKTSSSNRKEVKSIYKPLSTPGLGFVKPNTRSKTPPSRKTNAPKPRPMTPQPRSNFGKQGYPSNYLIAWNNSQQRSYLPWEICPPFQHPNQMQLMHRMFNTNNFGPMRYWGPNV